MAKSPPPKVVSMTTAQLEELLLSLREHLPKATFELVEGLLRTLQWILAVLAEKKTTLGRLCEVLFQSKSEKASQLFPAEAKNSGQEAEPKPKPKGHGRRKSEDYPGAKRVPDCKKFVRRFLGPNQASDMSSGGVTLSGIGQT